jgi:hypothetical protein
MKEADSNTSFRKMGGKKKVRLFFGRGVKNEVTRYASPRQIVLARLAQQCWVPQIQANPLR